MSSTVTSFGIPNCDQVRKARAWLGTHPSVVRRPILEHGHQVTVGFDSDVYQALF